MVDSRKKIATKENKIAIIDIVTIRTTATNIIISSKIKNIRFIIKLAISQ
jgi:hypothetical protein